MAHYVTYGLRENERGCQAVERSTAEGQERHWASGTYATTNKSKKCEDRGEGEAISLTSVASCGFLDVIVSHLHHVFVMNLQTDNSSSASGLSSSWQDETGLDRHLCERWLLCRVAGT